MNCGNCKFYTEKGQCVRFPPQLVLIASNLHHPIAYETCSAWPNVGKFNWCGEWQRKLSEQEAEPAKEIFERIAKIFEEGEPVEPVEEVEATSSGRLERTKCYLENPICGDLCLFCKQHKDLHVSPNMACPIDMGTEA